MQCALNIFSLLYPSIHSSLQGTQNCQWYYFGGLCKSCWIQWDRFFWAFSAVSIGIWMWNYQQLCTQCPRRHVLVDCHGNAISVGCKLITGQAERRLSSANTWALLWFWYPMGKTIPYIQGRLISTIYKEGLRVWLHISWVRTIVITYICYLRGARPLIWIWKGQKKCGLRDIPR